MASGDITKKSYILENITIEEAKKWLDTRSEMTLDNPKNPLDCPPHVRAICSGKNNPEQCIACNKL